MFPTNQNAQNALSKIPEAISKGTSGIILLPMNPTVDAVAAACSLYLGLSKLGKNVTIACSSPIQSEFVGADKIQNNLSTGGDNLVISFPFKEDSLDKVDYGFQGEFFNIIVTPRPGQGKLEPNRVKFSYTGGSLDFVFTIDTPNLNSLGHIYAENQNEFNGKTIINIDRHLVNDSYGVINFVNKTASSTSELILKVLQTLQIQIDKDVATNLYAGLTAATNNFTSYSVNADTFETASLLLKFGAVKKALNRPGLQGMPGTQSMGQSLGMPQTNRMPQMQMPPQRQMTNPNPLPRQQTPFKFPTSAPMSENQRPIEDVEDEAGNSEEDGTPQDWLKPKIFRGGGLV